MLVHGFSGNADDFATVRDELAQAHAHILLPELRGHGASTHSGDARAYTLEALAADLARFLEKQAHPAHLLAHSMAGMLALRVAVARPELCASLLLMSTSAEPLTGVDAKTLALAGTIARERGMGALAEVMRARAADDPARDDADRRVEREWGAARFWAWRRARLEAMDPHAYEALARAMLEQKPQRAQLKKIACPTTVLVGELDANFLAPSRRLAREIPGAELVVLPNAGHQPQHEAPSAWRASVLAHLARVSETPRSAR